MKFRTPLSIVLVLAILLIGLFGFIQPALASPASSPGFVVLAQAGPVQVDLSTEFIGVVAGALLSLACSYFPGLAPKYNQMSEDWKRMVMLLLMLAVTAGTVGLGCAGIIGGIACDQASITNYILTFFFAAMANQTMHSLSPRIGAKARQVEPAPGVIGFRVDYPHRPESQ